MSDSRYQMKVGIFVFIALVLVAALMINFSKGLSLFKPTYHIRLQSGTVAGIKPQASVMMSGVEIGKVTAAQLSDDGKFVTLRLKIYARYKIYSDAEFAIDSLGFLGDQYITIRPTKNQGDILKDGDLVVAQEPLNFQELAKASAGFIQKLDTTVKKINEVVTRLDTIVLTPANLTNLSTTIVNFKTASQRAVETVDGLSVLVRTNSPPLNDAVTNLVQFSRRLDKLGLELNEIVTTNGTGLTLAVQNFQEASRDVKNLTGELQDGKGLIGSLLKDEELKTNFASLVTNANSAAVNFSTFGSNINRQGLWRSLWKPKSTKPSSDRK